MGTKVKGLLRGLRYISQIFDEEKECEIQIGLPTDVKHVAHIGSDGSSIDGEDTNLGLPRDHPKSTRRHTSPKKEKTRHSRRHHLKDSESTNLINQDGSAGTDSHPEIPKTSRRKKSKDSSSSRSAKTRGSELLKSSSDQESS